MALIKINDTKAFRVEIIQMGSKKGSPRFLSIRQMYCTKKDTTWKPSRQGLTLPLDIVPRILKACIKVFKDPDPKINVIEDKQ